METLGAGSGGRNPRPLVESTDETEPQQQRGQQGQAAAVEEQERAKGEGEEEEEEEEEGGGKQTGVQEEGEEEQEYTPMLAAWALRGLRLGPLLSGGWSSTGSGREAAAVMECAASAPVIYPKVRAQGGAPLPKNNACIHVSTPYPPSSTAPFICHLLIAPLPPSLAFSSTSLSPPYPPPLSPVVPPFHINDWSALLNPHHPLLCSPPHRHLLSAHLSPFSPLISLGLSSLPAGGGCQVAPAASEGRWL